MTADRHGCITTYEEISLSMMIIREGMSATEHSCSLPKVRGISMRRLREVRCSEMLTKTCSIIWCLAPLALLTHCICPVQFPNFFLCLKGMFFKCYGFIKNVNPLTIFNFKHGSRELQTLAINDMQPHFSPFENESCIYPGFYFEGLVSDGSLHRH